MKIKIICIQTCSDWTDEKICLKGEDYFYEKSLSTNKILYVMKLGEILDFYGFFNSENFITLAEWREREINSILD